MPKRMQEPTGVDFWLETSGYFRKHTPRDPTCLFRAVSEQVYLTQYYHIRVREECIHFMKTKRHLFEENITVSFDHYLEQMACFTEWGSMNEIRAMSLLYKRDVIIFNGQKQTMENVTNNGFNNNNLLLCYIPPKQYETIYTIHQVQTAAYCQSVIYEALYKGVFNMPNIMTIAHKMLNDRSSVFRHDKFFQKGNLNMRPQLTADLYNNNKIEARQNNTDELQSNLKGIPPISYKAAKALNPDSYRNTDFDIWHEMRREVKDAGWDRHNSNELQVGGKCLINLNDLMEYEKNNNNLPKSDASWTNAKNVQLKQENNYYSGYIQEISTNKELVLIFIEELGEKRLVPYIALKPLPLVKKNKHNNLTVHNKKNVFTDTGRRWKKTYNSSRKRKDTINGANGILNNTNRNNDNINHNINNIDKIDFETDTRNVEVPKIEQCQVSDNHSMEDCSNYTTNEMVNDLPMAVISDNPHSIKINNIGQEIDEECKKANAVFTKNNVDNYIDKSIKSEISNNYDNSFQNTYAKPKMVDENYCLPYIGNSQINMGANPNLLFYVFPDGNLYPVFPFLSGNIGDLEQMDHLIQSRFFYNLGLEYFRVNQTNNYGDMAFGSGHQGAQSYGNSSPNTNMTNAQYVSQEEITRLVNEMQNCSLTYNEASGYSDGKNINADHAVSKTSFPNMNNVQNTKQSKQGLLKSFGAKDSSYQSSEKTKYNGFVNKGSKGNKTRHQQNTRESYSQHWNQYGTAVPNTPVNTYDSRIFPHMPQHLDQMQQLQQVATSSANTCGPYMSPPTAVFSAIPFYPNDAATEAAFCNPYYLANGSFVPVTCLTPPPQPSSVSLPPSPHHDTAENMTSVPPSYPPPPLPPIEAYSTVPSYPPTAVCPPMMFPPPQMQFPPIFPQHPPQHPPPSTLTSEHWYPMLGPPSHYLQYATSSAPVITETSYNGPTTGSIG